MNKILLIIALLFLHPAFSQDVNLSVDYISEKRYISNLSNEVNIRTKVNDLQIDGHHLIKIKEITEAVDDNGNSLQKQRSSFYGDYFNTMNLIDITLDAPNRQATQIKSIKGRLQYFTPTEENKGLVMIPDFMEQGNKNLLGEHYPGLTLTLIDKDALLHLKESDKKAFNKQLEKLHKEGNVGHIIAETAEYMKVFLDSFAGRASDTGGENDLFFYVEDKNDQIYDISIYNSQGNLISSNRKQDNNMRLIFMEEKVTPGCKMEILIENKNAVKELKFELNNIILP